MAMQFWNGFATITTLGTCIVKGSRLGYVLFSSKCNKAVLGKRTFLEFKVNDFLQTK